MQSIKEIKEIFTTCPVEDVENNCLLFASDERKGVQQAIVSAKKRLTAHIAEQERLELILRYERECYAAGHEFVAGIDEVGRGPLAGPVVAGVVILPKDCKIEGINDSKKLSAKKREELNDIILEKAISYGIGVVSPERIDETNISLAVFEAMRDAIGQLCPSPDFILADAVTIPHVPIPQKGIVKGDAKSASIGAASIIAKVYRDRLMTEYDKVYPEYGFASNAGYGSAAHMAALRVHGETPIHRKTFLRNFHEEETNREKGVYGEELAVKQMKKMGYKILERNFKRAGGEIDIIAEKDGYTAFVEVKYRKGRAMGEPAEAVTRGKQENIIQTAEKYIYENGLEGDFRFDVAEVLEENNKKYFRYTENGFIK